jgi:tetratricopeptide (TPR) repeat protein
MAYSGDSSEERAQVDAVQSALDHIQREEEFQEFVHQLAHRGLDLAAAGRIDEVEQVFSEALALARSRNLPRWEAQILFNTGVVFDRSAKPVIAAGYFEHALALFVEHGPLRMAVNVSIFLGNMLWKTGEPERAVDILQLAMEQANLGYETKQIDPEEYRAELFGVCNELVHAYYALGQYGQALAAYKLALEGVPNSLEEMRSLDLVVLDLYRDLGALHLAVDFGERVLARGEPQTAQDFQFVSHVCFSLGITHSMAEAFAASLAFTQRSYHAFRRSRGLEPRSPLLPEANDIAFKGRVFVNLGTAYNGLARKASLERNEQDWLRHVKAALAFWKHGEELLAQVGADDVSTPRGMLAMARGMFERAESFETLMQASEHTFQTRLREIGLDEAFDASFVGPGEFLVSPAAFAAPEVEDIAESERLIREGRVALLKKAYWLAQERFEEALEYDPAGRTQGRIWYALSCLWTGDSEEAIEVFEEVAEEGEGEGTLARILAEWGIMCRYPGRQGYWDWLRELFGLESEEEVLEHLTPFEIDIERGGGEGALHAGLLYASQGDYEACLQVLEGVDVTRHPFSPWVRSFWQALASASRGAEEQATGLLYNALAHGLPPLLLGPLRWLKQDKVDPVSWFARIAEPLLIAHEVYLTIPEPTPPTGPMSLPSQALRLAPIRPGLSTSDGTSGEEAVGTQLDLSRGDVRGPGLAAELILVEFDEVTSTDQERVLWPTRFAVRYASTDAPLAKYFQEVCIDYVPGSLSVLLVDHGLRPMTGVIAIPIDGRDYLVGHGSYIGRGGIFWVNDACGLPVHERGTTTRLAGLPLGMLAYFQALVNEAWPYVEIFCDSCHEQFRPVNGVWCEHIWSCPQCHHISSPVERSRKLIGEAPRLCTHRFPKALEGSLLRP